MESEELKNEISKVLPVVDDSGSDSAMMDNVLEFLIMSGMPMALAVMILIPEPWINDKSMSQKKKDFVSILCNYDGAMGWTGCHRILRW